MKLLTTSVVRGTQQGESHGGIYLIDLDQRAISQVMDWDRADIDWQGRGWDRGLRGIAFDNETIYIAASDELFAFSPTFDKLGSWRNPYLKHCHEIAVWRRTLYLTSTGYDSILGFDLDAKCFSWAMAVQTEDYRFAASRFDPEGSKGPLQLNKLHLNNVYCNEAGMYLSGLRSGGMLHFNGKTVQMSAELPPGTHNARPFRDGVLFNDSAANALRYAGRGDGAEDRAFKVPSFDPSKLTHRDMDESGVARQGFARGLCALSSSVVAGGSSPSTVSIYDLAANESVLTLTLSMDVRNAVHGLEFWPFD